MGLGGGRDKGVMRVGADRRLLRRTEAEMSHFPARVVNGLDLGNFILPSQGSGATSIGPKKKYVDVGIAFTSGNRSVWVTWSVGISII